MYVLKKRQYECCCVMYECRWLSGDEEKEAERACCPMMKGLID